MSDANRTSVAIRRSTATALPVDTAVAIVLRKLRLTGQGDLGFKPQMIVSDEIRSDAQITDLKLVGAEAGGTSPFEISAQTFDELIESAMLNVFTETTKRTGTSEITAFGAGTITVTNPSHFKIGHIVELQNLASGDAGRGIYFLTSVAGPLSGTPLTGTNTNALAGTFTAGATTTLRIVGFRTLAGGDIDAALSGSTGSITAPAGTFDNLFGNAVNIPVGAWIKLFGFAAAANNVEVRVRSRTAILIEFDAPTGFQTEAASGNVEVYYGDYVINGTQAISAHSFLVERSFEDHSPVTRQLLVGNAVNLLSLDLQPEAIARASVQFMGLTGLDAPEGTLEPLYTVPANVSRSAAADTAVYNTSSNVGRIGRGASSVFAGGQNHVLAAQLQLSGSLRRRKGVGVFGTAKIRAGEYLATGVLNCYFDTRDTLAIVMANTETSVDLTIRDVDGRAFTFDFPRIKFLDGTPNVPGKNQDVTISLPFQGLRHRTLGYTAFVQRNHYSR